MQNRDTSAAINRCFIAQPNSVDIADLEGWHPKLAAKRGVIQGIEVKKIKGIAQLGSGIIDNTSQILSRQFFATAILKVASMANFGDSQVV